MPQPHHATISKGALTLSLGLALLASLTARAADIEIRVEGELAAGDTLHAALQSADASDWTSVLRTVSATGERLSFTDVPPGRYAVQLFVDRNGNDRLDLSPRGIPLEPVGFSANPPLLRGKPAPRHCAFEHSGQTTRLLVPLRQTRKTEQDARVH